MMPNGFLPDTAPPAIASLVPELSWYVGGLAKIFGGGLRLAFTVAPSARCAYQLGQALKTTAVMPPMLLAAVMTRWIEDGTADLVRDFVREKTAARQAIALEVLAGFDLEGQPDALNVWLRLPEGVSRADVAARMQGMNIGFLPSDPFVVTGERPEVLRICLGVADQPGEAPGGALPSGQHSRGKLLARVRRLRLGKGFAGYGGRLPGLRLPPTPTSLEMASD